MSSESHEDSAPQGSGERRFTVGLFVFYIALVGLIVAYAFMDDVTQWWQHRKLQNEYIARMTLEPGDLTMKDAGARFDKDGDLNVFALISHELGMDGVGGVDRKQFHVNWDIAVSVDGERIHQRQFTASPQLSLLWISTNTPEYETLEGYFQSGAELQITISQGEREILTTTRSLEPRTLIEMQEQMKPVRGDFMGYSGFMTFDCHDCDDALLLRSEND